MSANVCRSCSPLFPAFLLGVAALFLVPSVGEASGDKAVSSRLLDTSPPEPPHHRDAWEAPPSKVPNDFVMAARLLFEQGLADPRGCEYRAIEVRTGSFQVEENIAPTHGWVLPARRGDNTRYAVCWNGLVYPLLAAGAKADLADDVRRALARRKPGASPEAGWEPQNDEAAAIWHKTLGRGTGLATALLLRLGDGEWASAWWAARRLSQDTRDDSVVSHPYLGLARQFTNGWAYRMCYAYQRGDDAAALADARGLMAFRPRAEAEAKALTPDADKLPDLGFPDLPSLLADLERRAGAGPRSAVVCLGPGRHPDAATRIARLIDRLDEACPSAYRSLDEDPLVAALIREGEPALEPLLQCYVQDRRVTRALHSIRSSARGRSLFTSDQCDVRTMAFAAIDGIMERLHVAPLAAAKLPDKATPQQEADALRKHIKTAKRVPPAERWFAVLADDKADPVDWADAALRLTDRAAPEPPRMLLSWPEGAFGVRPAPRQLLAEPMRAKAGRKLTDLLLRRIGQAEDTDRTALILALREWQPTTALEALAQETPRAREAERWGIYLDCVQARCELGDRKALNDYLVWIASATTRPLPPPSAWQFGLMERYPDHPGMAAAAQTLFGDERSPWLPLAGTRDGRDLLATGLLRLPAFRKAVLKELTDKDDGGTVTADPNAALSIRLSDGDRKETGGWPRCRELDMVAAGVPGTFRTCDYVAWAIGHEIEAAPRCELYWTEAKRDAAVTACTEFLRRYGDHLFRDPDYLKRDRPATPADVRAGKAIFSLERQGEARLVRGLDLTLPARWVTLKNRPYEVERTDPATGHNYFVKGYRQDGRIVQAEEVFKDGKWQRFYGFVGSNQAARVPAEEIEFPPPEPSWRERRMWVRVSAGLHARLEVPPLQVELIDDYPPRLPADTALTFGLVVRNGRGLEQPAPALEKSVRFRLLYSPETVSRQGALVPQATRDAEWTELKVKEGAAFKTESGNPLAVVEERKVAAFDLRQRFGVSKPGFYRLQLLPAVQEAGAVPEVSEIRFSLAPPQR